MYRAFSVGLPRGLRRLCSCDPIARSTRTVGNKSFEVDVLISKNAPKQGLTSKPKDTCLSVTADLEMW
jgi:hypothetical protein